MNRDLFNHFRRQLEPASRVGFGTGYVEVSGSFTSRPDPIEDACRLPWPLTPRLKETLPLYRSCRTREFELDEIAVQHLCRNSRQTLCGQELHRVHFWPRVTDWGLPSVEFTWCAKCSRIFATSAMSSSPAIHVVRAIRIANGQPVKA